MQGEDKDKTVTVRNVSPPIGMGGQCTPYLLVLSGSSVGRVIKLELGPNKLGRSVDADIMIDDDGISRLHASVKLLSNNVALIQDLGSTNGTHVDGVEIEEAGLLDGQKIQLGTSTILKYSCSDHVEERFITRLYESATRDALTKANNRAFFQECLSREFAWHVRHNQPLSLIMFDIDHFKQVNDTCGHPAGDQVLQQISRRCFSQLRTEDLFARWGGEEFVILLRQTLLVHATQFAERLRAYIADEPFDVRCDNGQQMLTVTVSLGVSMIEPKVHLTDEALLEETDQRLYRAKAAGRNRVVSS